MCKLKILIIFSSQTFSLFSTCLYLQIKCPLVCISATSLVSIPLFTTYLIPNPIFKFRIFPPSCILLLYILVSPCTATIAIMQKTLTLTCWRISIVTRTANWYRCIVYRLMVVNVRLAVAGCTVNLVVINSYLHTLNILTRSLCIVSASSTGVHICMCNSWLDIEFDMQYLHSFDMRSCL